MLFYYTPVSRAVLQLMPVLKHAEFKVLLVINNKTVGWKDTNSPNGRKLRDWIAISQFETETNLCRRIIGHAIQSLVVQGHIIVTDKTGSILDTPAKRHHQPRLYFQLSIRLIPPSEDFDTYKRRNVASLAQKMRYTK